MPADPPTPDLISVDAYAEHRGVSGEAVRKQIRRSALRESVVAVGGRWWIRDVAAADAEWTANTRPRADRAPVVEVDEEGGHAGSYYRHRAAREEALARLDAHRADLAEIELAERRGELLTVEAVEANLVGVFGRCRNKLLGVPARARQSDPTLTPVQIALLENLIREALEDLATAEEAAARDAEHEDDDAELAAAEGA